MERHAVDGRQRLLLEVFPHERRTLELLGIVWVEQFDGRRQTLGQFGMTAFHDRTEFRGAKPIRQRNEQPASHGPNAADRHHAEQNDASRHGQFEQPINQQPAPDQSRNGRRHESAATHPDNATDTAV